MRKFSSLFIASAVVLVVSMGLLNGPVYADDGSPFDPGDGRIAPLTGDRVAVYCHANDIEVWGVDVNDQGFPLAWFDQADIEAAQQGPVVVNAGTLGRVTLTVNDEGEYFLTWLGGEHGATGVGGYVKTFECGFEFEEEES